MVSLDFGFGLLMISTSRLKLFLFNSTMSTTECKDNRIKVLHTTLYNTTIHPYAAHVLRHKSAVPATVITYVDTYYMFFFLKKKILY